MKKFDFKDINKYDIYIGNIMLITYVSQKILEDIKNIDGNIEDFSVACNKVLAKKDVLLLKLNSSYFVDLDMIKSTKDMYYINYCLENNITDNILLKIGTKDPYVGQLFIKNIKKIKKIDKLLEKKLNTLN